MERNVDSSVELHPKYDLFKTRDRLYVKPSTFAPGDALVFNRISGEIKLENLTSIPSMSTRISIVGVLGLVRMMTSKYLIVVETVSRVGPEGDLYYLSDTWRIDKVNTIPIACRTVRKYASRQDAQLDSTYMYHILELLNSQTFFFSYDVDLSHSTKGVSEINPKESLFRRMKKRFIWNYTILMPFLRIESAAKFVIPAVNGYVGTKTVQVADSILFLSVISRRKRHRCGRRYFCRGVDSKGFSANFVETELLIEVRKARISFVMTRSSFPFFWTQWPDLWMSPNATILSNESSDLALDKHIEQLREEYGNLHLVNLFTHNKESKRFSEFFEECLSNSVHRHQIEVSTIDLLELKWGEEELHQVHVYSALRDIMTTILTSKTGYKQKQKGVFHTCSIEGVDLTDVFQFTIAKTLLPSICLSFELSSVKSEKPLSKILTAVLSNLWMENSDSLAMYYVGTRALRSEYFRRHNAPPRETWMDVSLKFQRWYNNNFCDGFVNDTIDILTKNRCVASAVGRKQKTFSQRAKANVDSVYWTYWIPSWLVFSLLNASFALLRGEEGLKCALIWACVVICVLIRLYRKRSYFVNTPQFLKKPDPQRAPMDWYFVEG